MASNRQPSRGMDRNFYAIRTDAENEMSPDCDLMQARTQNCGQEHSESRTREPTAACTILWIGRFNRPSSTISHVRAEKSRTQFPEFTEAALPSVAESRLCRKFYSLKTSGGAHSSCRRLLQTAGRTGVPRPNKIRSTSETR